MNAEDRKAIVNTLEEKLLQISQIKTRILEIQGCLVDEPEYNDETMDEPFELIDVALEDTKRNLADIIYQLSNID